MSLKNIVETVNNAFVEELFELYNIDEEDAVSIYLKMHKKDIDKLISQGIHNYKISEPKIPGGIWSTYVRDETRPNNRRQIQGRSKEAFYQSLYS